MSDLDRRLRRLESSGRGARYTGPPPELLVFMKMMDNAQRELHGLDPIPFTPEEERVKYESDKQFLEEVAPKYRQSRGWQSEAAQAGLDLLEATAREKVTDYERRCKA